MRLKRFLIEKYGNIERADLAFDPSPGCINLLLAPNGAGKSVLRRAFHDLLFGIPLQSDMKFRFDYPGMHLLAHAVSAEGEEYAFGWQRKAGRSFPGADTNPGASRWLAELLAAVTPRQVEMLFALDTERLRIGGKELAASDGTVGAALLSGTGELASARALRKSLEARSAALWEKGKSKPPLNSALSRLNEANAPAPGGGADRPHARRAAGRVGGHAGAQACGRRGRADRSGEGQPFAADRTHARPDRGAGCREHLVVRPPGHAETATRAGRRPSPRCATTPAWHPPG